LKPAGDVSLSDGATAQKTYASGCCVRMVETSCWYFARNEAGGAGSTATLDWS